MRPILTAVVAAIEAVAVAVAGIAVVAVPALLLWGVSFGMAAEPSDAAANALAVWFLAHGAPLTFSLSTETAVSFGLAAEPLSFTLSLLPLGVTLITVLLALRSGWRFGARGGAGVAGVLGGALGFALVASLLVPFVAGRIAWSDSIAILVPALVYGCASGAAFLVRAARDDHDWWSATLRWKQRMLDRAGVPGVAALPARLAEIVRLAAALLAGLIGIAALGFAAAIVSGYVSITTLAQSLQLDGLGTFLLFLLQAAYLPTLLLWSVSWLSGAGFAVGAGSSASPFGALLGPMPALPIFGAIPQGWGAMGVIAPVLVGLVGFGIAAFFAGRAEIRRATWVVALVVPVVAAVGAGIATALLVSVSTGSIGPDRLATVGPDPWVVGGLIALELGVGAVLGVTARKVDYGRVRAVLPGVPALAEHGLSREGVLRRREDARDAALDAGSNDGLEVTERETVELSEVRAMRTLSETEEPESAMYVEQSRESNEPPFVQARDPELFDQESVDPDPDPVPESGDPEPRDSVPAQEQADDLVTEELLRAYSWDSAQLEDVDEDRKGWPWKGKER